jgi:hypothetical protein
LAGSWQNSGYKEGLAMESYNLAAVRGLLDAALNTSEIDTLAFDLFQPVYREFAPSMAKAQKIQAIVGHAEQHGRIPNLLAYVE